MPILDASWGIGGFGLGWFRGMVREKKREEKAESCRVMDCTNALGECLQITVSCSSVLERRNSRC